MNVICVSTLIYISDLVRIKPKIKKIKCIKAKFNIKETKLKKIKLFLIDKGIRRQLSLIHVFTENVNSRIKS